MNRPRFFPWAALAVFVVVPPLTGCSQNDADGGLAENRTVYVCTETMDVVVAEARETPAVNPKTGRRTLMRGLYCRKCETWHPTPPLDVLQRNPGSGLCPKTGTPLTANGPLPNESPLSKGGKLPGQ